MRVRRRPLLATLADWVDSHLSAGGTPSSPEVPRTVVEHVVIRDAQLIFADNDGEWLTVDLIAGSGWSSLQGIDRELSAGQPVTLKLEIEPGTSQRLVDRRVDLLRSWSTGSTRLMVEVTRYLEGPGATRIVMVGGGRSMDVSATK